MSAVGPMPSEWVKEAHEVGAEIDKLMPQMRALLSRATAVATSIEIRRAEMESLRGESRSDDAEEAETKAIGMRKLYDLSFELWELAGRDGSLLGDDYFDRRRMIEV